MSAIVPLSMMLHADSPTRLKHTVCHLHATLSHQSLTSAVVLSGLEGNPAIKEQIKGRHNREWTPLHKGPWSNWCAKRTQNACGNEAQGFSLQI